MKLRVAFSLLALLVILGACATQASTGRETETSTSAPSTILTETTSAQTEISDPVTIRVAVLPLIDTLPMLVADQEGIFESEGISVEFIPVASAPERDQLIQAGQADATVNEILSDMFFNRESVKMQAVRYALMASQDYAHFFIMASGQSGITTVEGLKGIEIGISQGTIIEYVMERLLEKEGFQTDEIVTVAIPKMPDRMALLASGELKAGVLPDPLAALSVQQGSVIVLDDRNYPSFGASVISFSKEFIDQNPGAVRSFLEAIERAVELLGINPSKYVSLLSDKQLVPPPLLGTYIIPIFPKAGVTSDEEWADALNWAKKKGLLTEDINYADSVTSEFLP